MTNHSAATYICFNKADTKGGKNYVDINGKRYKLAKKRILSPNLNNLEQILHEITKDNKLVIFGDFHPFKAQPNKLRVLKEDNINFKFINFNNLTKHTIDAIIELLEYDKNFRSNKIREGLAKTAKPLGNPDLQKKNPKTPRKRRLAALKDESYQFLKGEIVKMREGERMSFSDITKYLNEHFSNYAKGQRFYRTSVERLYNSFVTLQKRFHQNTTVALGDEQVGGTTEKRKELQLTGIRQGQNFDKQIQFRILSPLQQPFQVVIKDYDNKIVFKRRYEAAQKEQIIIDLDDEVLLAGLHSLFILPEEEEYQIVNPLFIKLRENLLAVVSS